MGNTKAIDLVVLACIIGQTEDTGMLQSETRTGPEQMGKTQRSTPLSLISKFLVAMDT